jgi:hypothetical protein
MTQKMPDCRLRSVILPLYFSGTYMSRDKEQPTMLIELDSMPKQPSLDEF